jgi:hypothetical protein
MGREVTFATPSGAAMVPLDVSGRNWSSAGPAGVKQRCRIHNRTMTAGGNVAPSAPLFVHVGTSGSLLSNASDLYLVFLGGPYAAAVLATISTSANVGQGRLVKSTAQQPSLFDVASDDNGNVDLYDFQYTLFNLIAIIIVIFTFICHPGHGLPAIPDFQVVLTSGSALTYTVSKAVASSGPQILSVSPSTARIGDILTISTSQLISQKTVSAAPTVTVGGVAATNVAVTPGAPNTVRATVASPSGGSDIPERSRPSHRHYSERNGRRAEQRGHNRD